MVNYYIKTTEFQEEILKFITTEEYKKILENMIDGDDKKFQMGFIQGLCWSSILTSTIPHYTDKGEVNGSNSETRTGFEDSSSAT